ncbi:MAG: polysulfide reductase NrfD [Acidimicrobiaceae bacterium]|nr:polysulfide reductase NrfD [Acidimicrobiaceae bacterium]
MQYKLHRRRELTQTRDLAHPRTNGPEGSRPVVRWAKLIDQSLCIGCHACTTACKSENEVPLGVTRTYVKSVDVGVWPNARRAFQVTRCNQCENPPCVAACPTGAMYQRADGIVDFDKKLCIGCKACMAACPYDAIFINPEDHSAEKCNFCAHRIEIGLEPACVTVCPTQAILIGDLNDPSSKVSRLTHRTPVQVRRPEKETRPKLFYRGAHYTTLDPLAASQPQGSTYAWSQIPTGKGQVSAGVHQSHKNSSAAAVISYDVAHSAPWGWRVSLYTWTKSIAAGAFLVPALIAIFSSLKFTSDLVKYDGSALTLIFLAVTGVLLIWDLKHPLRFYLLFTHPQWRSWLVRGGFLIAMFGAVALLTILSGLLNDRSMTEVLIAPGIPLATMSAVYTAYLFAQAKARDMWQSPLLPPHLFIQATLAGSATLLILTKVLHQNSTPWLARTLALSCAIHLLFVLGETTMRHPTRHARQATHNMVFGQFAATFWGGILLVGIGLLAPQLGAVAAVSALVGLLAHEHSFVQAGQSVPLA